MKSKITLLFAALALIGQVAHAQYCDSYATSTADSRINSVNLVGETTTINQVNTAGCQNYTDYTAVAPADMIVGQAYTVNVQHGTCGGFFNYTRGHKIYIDFNQDGDFDDPLEDQGVSTFSSAATWNYAHTINIPATASLGNTRMRIVAVETSSAAAINACGLYTKGETEDYTVFLTTLNLTAFTPDTLTLRCYNSNDGQIVALAAGLNAVPPYTYTWSNGGSNNDTLSNLTSGTYSVIITDNNGAMDTSYTEYLAPDTLYAEATVDIPLICDYDESAVSVEGWGGTPSLDPYVWDTNSANYRWDTSISPTQVLMGFNNAVSQPLDIGFDFEFFGDTYDQFLMAANGFISFDQFTDNGCCDGDPIPFAAAFEPNNAVYAVWDYYTATAFSSNYSYFTEGEAPNRVTVISFEDLPICCGTFPPRMKSQIKLFETSNCIEIHTEYWDNPGFGGATQGIENSTGTVAFTYPGRNGGLWTADSSFISFCATDSNGLTYEWSTGFKGKMAAGWQPGDYDVSVTDANGCVTVDSITIDAPISTLVDTNLSTDVDCFGNQNGIADPGVTGGVLPYQYTWNTSATTATLPNVGPGNYSVSVQDNVGCTIEVSDVIVWEPSLLLAAINNVTNVNCPGDTNGAASGVAAGGVAPYTYMWSPGNMMGQSVSGLADGSYNFVVTDSNGCQSFASVAVVAENSLPVVDLGPDIFSANGGEFILDAGTHTSYSWSNGGSSQTNTITESGKYRVTVTNEAGCSASDEVEVEIWPTGVNSLTNTGINVYPNPASVTFNIEIENADNASVEIMDAKGSLVKTVNTLNTGVNTVDISELNTGIYFLNIHNDDTVVRHQLSVTK